MKCNACGCGLKENDHVWTISSDTYCQSCGNELYNMIAAWLLKKEADHAD